MQAHRLKLCSLTPALLFCVISAFCQEEAIDPDRIANTIILDDAGVKNLRIQTVMVEERPFETTVFAIGRIEEVPERQAVLSSRIAGRIVALNAFLGDTAKKGQILAKVESRQPGNPPPVIELAAPRDGVIVASHVRLGEPVEPAQDLLDITDRSKMWAVAKIPENSADEIGPGTKARLRIPALGEDSIQVTMVMFGVEADREAGTVEGIFVVDNPQGRLKPGMRAEFGIVTAARDFVLSVPRHAVQGDPTKRVVFVKDFDLPNAYVKAPVVLGQQNDEYVEVLQGLFPGDEVVTRGSYALSFAGGGGGMSLKDALDAAHGHEHNEDGSEVESPQNVAASPPQDGYGHNTGYGKTSRFDMVVRVWAGITSAISLLWLQGVIRRRHEKAAA